MRHSTPAQRHDGRTLAVRAAFLQVLRDSGRIVTALAAVRRSRSGTRTVVVDSDGKVIRSTSDTGTRLWQHMLTRLDHLAGIRRFGQRESRSTRQSQAK